MKNELTRRSFLKMVGVGFGALAIPQWLPALAQPAGKRPNIIIILADDLGYECLGVDGGRSFKTPNLDQLAAGGMRFEHCYAQPLCTPTRVQMMTGIYNVRNYTRFAHMDEGQVTFAQLLKRAGYATAITGKWQLAGDAEAPRRFGFDEYCLWQHLRRPPRYANPGLEINGKEVDFHNGEYGPDLIHAAALDFIQRNKDQPFFLYYTMLIPHDPWQPTPDSPDWDPKAIGEKVNNSPKHFADNLAYLDKQVGALVAKLDELRVRDNTLIFFLGDNGTGARIVTKMADGREVQGGKGQSTDAGTRVPLIVSQPGVVPAGVVSRDLVDSTDFLPTICAVAGATVPAELAIDGHSFLPQLRAEKGQAREWIYSWFSMQGGPVATKEFARNQRYKLYTNGQFFDVASDPLEKNPLPADSQPAAVREQLQSALGKYKHARSEKFAKAGGKPGGKE